MVLNRCRERRVDTVSWELSDALLFADATEILAVDSADSEHFLLFHAKLLKLRPIPSRVGLYNIGLIRIRLGSLTRAFVELNDTDSLFTVQYDLLLEVLLVVGGHGGSCWVIHGLSSCHTEHASANSRAEK